MSTVVRTELPVIILHVLVAAADIPVCAHQNRECERRSLRSACGCLVPSARALRLQAPGRMHAALPEFRGTGLHGSVRLASRAPAFRCAGDRAGSGSTHEQPLQQAVVREFYLAAQNAHEGLLQTFIQSYSEQIQV